MVGAGPAGLSTAKFAAKKNLNVLVVEKKKEVGYPSPCAGYVSKMVSRYFDIDKRWIQQEIERMRTYSNGRAHTTSMQGWIVDRKLFDKSLSIEAARAGAKISVFSKAIALLKKKGVVEGISFMRDGKIHKIKADVVVGADGVPSNIAKWAGLPFIAKSDMAVCPQYEMANVKLDDPFTAETYFDVDYAPGGYAWIYPTGKDTAKVGLGILKSIADASPVEYLDRFVKEHPISSKKFERATTIGMLTGLVPISGAIAKTYTDSLLLVGDAAGMTDSISGAGILSGILAGKIAAEVVYDAVQEGDTSHSTLAEYEKRWTKLIGRRLIRAKRKRDILNEAYVSNRALEHILPETWIAFKEFWIKG